MKNKVGKIILMSAAFSFLATVVFAQATIGSLDQNADQSQGQYMPMNLGYAGFNSLGMTQSAWLDPLQNLGEGQSKPAYSRYYWSPDLILPIRLREGMMTLLNFPEWELIEDMYIGDSATFDGQITGPNTILLYPRKGANVGVDTNIIIFGRSGNKYVFYVKSEGVNTERLTNSIIDIEVIDGASGSKGAGLRGGSGNSAYNKSSGSVDSLYTKRNQKSNWIESIPLDASKFRFDIEVYIPNPEDVVIAPERVWRDDIFTYIDLGEKSLTMTQRPIVTLIVERIEVPVGFRTKGPNNRLIIVEGVGDMVMRNGKRMICLKLRRSDEAGLEFTPTTKDLDRNNWDVPAPLPEKIPSNKHAASSLGDIYSGGNASSQGMNGAPVLNGEYNINIGSGEVVVPSYGTASAAPGGGINITYQQPAVQNGKASAANIDYQKMQRISNNHNYAQPGGFNFNASSFALADNSNISIELGTDGNVSQLESLWGELSKKYSDTLGKYEPFFSVDAAADGQGKELFHLRVGPVDSLETGDEVCSRLGRNGVFCSVVRTQ